MRTREVSSARRTPQPPVQTSPEPPLPMFALAPGRRYSADPSHARAEHALAGGREEGITGWGEEVGGMPRRERDRIEPTDDWRQLEYLVQSPGQRTYELIRPVVLFGRPPVERAAATSTA